MTRSDYRLACDLLALRPDWRLRPAARRYTLPRWFVPELISTAPAQDKLAAWARSAPRPWRLPTPGEAVARLAATGDWLLTCLVARLLSRRGMPPPLTSFALQHVHFVLVGAQLAGWAGSPVRTNRPYQVVVACSPGEADAFTDVAAHELVHCWQMPEPPAGVPPPTAFAFQTLSVATVPANLSLETHAAVWRHRAHHRHQERLVLALTRRLGFKDVGAEACL